MQGEKQLAEKEAIKASQGLRKEGHRLAAEKKILDAMNAFPGSLGLMIERAEIAMSWRSWGEAIERWEAIIQKGERKTPSSAYARYSESLRQEGRYDDADKAIRNGLAIDPNKFALLIEDAQVAWQRNELDRVAASLQGAYAVKGSLKAREHARLVSALRRTGKISEAEKRLETALLAYPEHKGLRGEKFEIDMLADKSLTESQQAILRLLRYTTSHDKAYSAIECPAGYQSIEIDGRKFDGLRPADERFVGVPIDFTGKTVLDIGCNQGAMLFEIADKIKRGIGIDYDHTMVNVCNRIRSHREITNLDFFSFDLQKEDFDLIGDLIPGGRVDMVFLLAVCRWVRNYPDLMAYCAKISDTMLFEPNGPEKDEQIGHLKRIYSSVELLDENYEHAKKHNVRSKLYLCSL